MVLRQAQVSSASIVSLFCVPGVSLFLPFPFACHCHRKQGVPLWTEQGEWQAAIIENVTI